MRPITRPLGLAVFWVISFFGLRLQAYPNFIGYSYTTCVTCHYNTLGHGPLNDYGRALFSQEIAARPFLPASVSDEELADRYSGFIPGKELPAWIRPGLKYRGLWMQMNPGSKETIKRWIPMQKEVNLALMDPKQDYVLTLVWNELPEERDLYGKGTPQTSIFREQSLRIKATKKLFVTLGLFDKAYGIRNIDHTAVNRSVIGLGAYSQTHGVQLHWMESDWDWALHWQAGNLNAAPEIREKGFSTIGEYEIGEKHRLGGSLLVNESEQTKMLRLAVHDRWGLSKTVGASLMWEIGLSKTTPKASGIAATGTYQWVEALIPLARGYNLLSTLERWQREIKSSSPELQRWSLGFLTFPFQRTEVRLAAVNAQSFSSDQTSGEQWAIQGQVHVSW